jgi:hypothetical protein
MHLAGSFGTSGASQLLTAGRTDGRAGGLMAGQTDRLMTDGRKDRRPNSDRLPDCLEGGRTGRGTDRRTDAQTDSRAGRKADGRTDKWPGGRAGGRPLGRRTTHS